MKQAQLDHVAILVGSIEDAVVEFGLTTDPAGGPAANVANIEEFPAEGTRELYVGEEGRPALLLLMQPLGPGPYQQAMEKRGPGLHHVAFYAEDLQSFTEGLSGTGWLLHPSSLRLMSDAGQIWLCQAGVQVLVEVSDGRPRYTGSHFVTRVSVPTDRAGTRTLEASGLPGLAAVAHGPAVIQIGNREIPLAWATTERSDDEDL